MPEIGTYGLMSGDGKQGDAGWPKPLRPSSTLPEVGGHNAPIFVRVGVSIQILRQIGDLCHARQRGA